jgi:hypothetical protein
MAFAVSTLPIGLGGDAGLVWRAPRGGLPASFTGATAEPAGMGAAADAESVEGMRGAVFQGAGRLESSGFWRAVCSKEAHRSDRLLPAEIEFSVAGERFRFLPDAVEDLADAGLPGSIDDVVDALEKLAARLPAKTPKRHSMPEIEGWEIEVDTGTTPWRVHRARSGSGD